MNLPFWSDLALAELHAIGIYIEQFDPAAAERVVAEIDRATLRLADFPLSGTRVRGRRLRKLSVPKFEYVIYYEPGDVTTIVRVVHAPPPAMKSVGLLGGSFNPAHAGHRHISVEALRRLGLDEVWWLVSPLNPLKDLGDMAPLDARVGAASAVAQHRAIRVTDAEQRLGTRFAVDTVAALQRAHPNIRFIWLMGADNLIQLHRWSRWRRLAARVPIAVFARPGYMRAALTASATAWFGVGGMLRLPRGAGANGGFRRSSFSTSE